MNISRLRHFNLRSNEDSGQTYFRSVMRQRMVRIQFSLFCFQPEIFRSQSQYSPFPASIAVSFRRRTKLGEQPWLLSRPSLIRRHAKGNVSTKAYTTSSFE